MRNGITGGIRFSWLDVKLGGRMLVRYPGLTLVAGLAMAFAIAVGAATFEVVNMVLHPTLPLPDGDRIVGLNYWDRRRNEQALPGAYDLQAWRTGLKAVQHVGGFRLAERNLFVGTDVGVPIEVAEISASAFRAIRVPPLLGRSLVDADESPGASPVVLIGHRIWQRRFNGDPAIVGAVVRLGEIQATVVGVMPEGFLFPIDNDVWTPLKLGPPASAPGGPPVQLFGRLAPGVTLAEAQSEAATAGRRVAADFPKEYESRTAQVLPYPQSIIWIPPDRVTRAGIYSVNGFAALLLVLVCGNVALLMFARAATREREILVRNALGASRARIMTQLFAEALVLGVLASLLGLAAASGGLELIEGLMREDSGDDGWPFWWNAGLSGTTLLYAGLLTLGAAGIAGVVPAIKVTGRGMESRLRQATVSGGLRMGGLWTGMIIAQIAATVVFTAFAYVVQRQASAIGSVTPAFPSTRFLAARFELAVDSAAPPERLLAIVGEIERRLAARPEVVNVTVAENLPLMPHSVAYIETEASGPADSTHGEWPRVRVAAVAEDFFQVFGAPIIAGRGFDSGDLAPGARTVVVNQSFVDQILGGRNPIGQRVRDTRRSSTDVVLRDGAPPAPWLEIVGVVRDLVPDIQSPLRADRPSGPQLYSALGRGVTGGPLYLAAHTHGDPASLAPTLRRIASDVSPELRLRNIEPLDRASSSDIRAWSLMAGVILLASAITLILSLAGIYSIMSFTVSRRTREIGVRVALGGQAPRVVFEMLRRPLRHVASGVVVGCVLVGGLVVASRSASATSVGLLAVYAVAMLAVLALACIGPTLRALRVEPTEAMRAEV